MATKKQTYIIYPYVLEEGFKTLPEFTKHLSENGASYDEGDELYEVTVTKKYSINKSTTLKEIK